MMNAMTDVQMYEAVEKCMDEVIRPYLMADGGNAEIDLVKGKEVVISFEGNCGSCPSSAGGTLRGIERALRQSVDPEIIVIATNSYQAPTNQRHPFGGMTYEEQIEARKQK
jgi:Fe-S cluster biogenesis protein NfuA